MLPPTPPAPPFPFVGISALVLLYVVIFYLVSQDDDLTEDESSSIHTSKEENYSGLSIEEMQQLPWFYSHVNTTTTCAVCLEDFQVGEKCRIIPVCSHIFHTHCIDIWLVKKPTCPICRSPLKPKATVDIV